MKKLFDSSYRMSYNDMPLLIHWNRSALKEKQDNIFGNNQIVEVEKDYISFDYKDVHISDRYLSDEADLEARVWKLCHIYDTEGKSGLENFGANCENLDK